MKVLLLLFAILVHAVSDENIPFQNLFFQFAAHAIITNHDGVNYLAFGAGRYENSEKLALEGARNISKGIAKNLEFLKKYCAQNGIPPTDRISEKLNHGYSLLIIQANALEAVLANKTAENNARLMKSAKEMDDFINVGLFGKIENKPPQP